MPTTVWRSSAKLQLCVADLANNNNKAIISLSSFDTIEEEMFEQQLSLAIKFRNAFSALRIKRL